MATKTKMPKQRVCYALCYRDPNYTRTASVVNALSLIESVELKVVKNSRRGFLRYIEVPLKLLAARLTFRPDVFVVGFRADEIFWALYPAMAGKKIIFDEFIILHDWLISEHSKIKAGSVPAKLVDTYMRWVLGRAAVVLTDTTAHAQLAAAVYNLPKEKIVPVPVGADESLFKPAKPIAHKNFEVFYYGTALPLHGVPVILEAAKLVAIQNAKVHFSLVGGKGNSQYLSMVTDFVKVNQLEVVVSVEPWVDYKDLPSRIAAADICLGGPFGGTGQARRVVSGKTYQFLACGRATVVGQIDGKTKFIDKQNCLLVKQGSPQELANAILWAANNPTKLEAIAKAGRQLFEKEFSANAISQILEDKVLA